MIAPILSHSRTMIGNLEVTDSLRGSKCEKRLSLYFILTLRSPIAYCLIASFSALAYWMSIELFVLVYITFKRHNSVYFRSIFITIIGVILQTTGYILTKFENHVAVTFVLIISKLGWVLNVTGFSIVLWSRLHLVVNDSRILSGVLVMILLDGIIFHTITIVFEVGLTEDRKTYYTLAMVMERVQQTVFAAQETIISFIYIWQTVRFLRNGFPVRTRKVVGSLLFVQIVVISLDIILTVLNNSNKMALKRMIHPFFYAIKLKLEFIVLNQLQSLVKSGVTPGLSLTSNQPFSDSHFRTSAQPTPASITQADPRNKSLDIESMKSTAGSSEIEGKESDDESDQTMLCSKCRSISINQSTTPRDSGVDDIEPMYPGRRGGGSNV
jgi:hypothetical protein